MPTPEECRHNAETCLKLASQTEEIYARLALIELADEFRAMAEYLDRGNEHYRSGGGPAASRHDPLDGEP